ncbi:MAG: hypothetical protein OEM18_03675 [Nitrosopumilus sp.]|jgi:hypothetical protein|nr:hypothetical protein [Nitrosopumilus sp.]MDH3502438.1 hypothetical protein [Nitrosopumilus sp.]
MSLREQTRQILNDFENTSSEKITDALDEIKNQFQSDLTREYLQGKINEIANVSTETDKKKLCKNLIPYLDWYLQGT